MNFMHNVFPDTLETGPPEQLTPTPGKTPALPSATPSEVTNLTNEDLRLIALFFDYPEFAAQALQGDLESQRYMAVEIANLAREAATDENARKLLARLASLGFTDAAWFSANLKP